MRLYDIYDRSIRMQNGRGVVIVWSQTLVRVIKCRDKMAPFCRPHFCLFFLFLYDVFRYSPHGPVSYNPVLI